MEHLAANDAAPSEVTVGAHLELDPKTETFTNDERANQLLTREYRKPFVVPAASEV